MKELTLEDAKRLYASTGFCEHEFVESVEPYGCNVKILNCKVCAEELSRHYIINN